MTPVVIIMATRSFDGLNDRRWSRADKALDLLGATLLGACGGLLAACLVGRALGAPGG